MLHSASQNPSGIPQKILDEKAEEIRAKKEKQTEINVRQHPRFALFPPGLRLECILPFRQTQPHESAFLLMCKCISVSSHV